MRSIIFMLGMLAVGVLFATGPEPATAEPGKNKITSETSSCSNGENYTFTINAMGKVGQLQENNSNLIIKRYTLTYFDPESGELIGRDTYGGGKKTGLKGDLVRCEGENTTELQGLGLVRIVFELSGFVTPQGDNQ